MKKIYCVICTIDNFYHEFRGYFETLEEAEEALESLWNSHIPKTTNCKIYSRGLGLNSKSELVINKQINNFNKIVYSK